MAQKSDPGLVYFIQAGEGGPIKIGITRRTLESRLDDLATSNPADLRVLAAVPGTYATERRMHSKFRAHQIRGEWFEPTDVILRLAARVRRRYGALSEPPAPKAPPKPPLKPATAQSRIEAKPHPSASRPRNEGWRDALARLRRQGPDLLRYVTAPRPTRGPQEDPDIAAILHRWTGR